MSTFKQVVLGNTSWCGEYCGELTLDMNIKYVKIEDNWWCVMNDAPKILPDTLNPEILTQNTPDLQRKCYQNRMLAMYVSKLSNEKIIKVMSL